MANNQKWETVGAKSKPGKKTKLSKTAKQALIDSMKSIDELPQSVKESPLFGLEPEHLDTGIHLKKESPKSAKPTKKKVVKKQKKPQEQKVQTFKNAVDAMKSDAFKTFGKQAKEIENNIESNVILMCSEIALGLNSSVKCTESLTVETTKDFSYPFSKAPKSVQDVLSKYFGEKIDSRVAPVLFERIFTKMLDCISRDESSLGYQLCIQALVSNRKKNQNCLSYVTYNKLVADIISLQNQPKKCFAYMWAVSQVAIHSPVASLPMEVWLGVMLPTLSVKCVATYSLEFIEKLTKKGVSIENMTVHHFLQICKWSLQSNETCTKAQTNIKKRLEKLYPEFEQVVEKSKVLKDELFVHYMQNPVADEATERKMIELCAKTLKNNNFAVSHWRESYLQSLTKTRQLMEYLDTNESVMKSAMTNKVFVEIIRSFHNTNQNLVEENASVASKNDFHKIKKFCEKHYTNKMPNQSSSKIFSFLFQFLLVISAVMVGCVLLYNRNPQFRTQTDKVLADTGLDVTFVQVKANTFELYEKTKLWSENELPMHIEQMRQLVHPYYKVIEKNVNVVCEKLQPVITRLEPYYQEYIVKNYETYSKVVIKYVLEVTNYLLNQYTTLCKYILQQLKLLNAKVQSSDFDITKVSSYFQLTCCQKRKIKEFFYSFWSNMQDNFNHVVLKIKETFDSLTSQVDVTLFKNQAETIMIQFNDLAQKLQQLAVEAFQKVQDYVQKAMK